MYPLFAREFLPRLPRIVQDDVRFQVSRRKRRTNATQQNIDRFTNDSVKHALKYSPFIEDKYTFVDERSNAPERQRLHSSVRSSVELNHRVLMCDEALEHLATNLTEMFTRLIQMTEIEEGESSYVDALEKVFYGIREDMKHFYIKAPQIKKKHETIEDAERELERAIRRCLDVSYLVRKFKFLRTQYIEYSQIALSRVGGNKGQRKYVSSRSYARREKKQIEAEQFVNSMSVLNDEQVKRLIYRKWLNELRQTQKTAALNWWFVAVEMKSVQLKWDMKAFLLTGHCQVNTIVIRLNGTAAHPKRPMK